MILGFYASMQETMIFEKLGDKLQDMKKGTDFQQWIAKPLGTCPICMSSLYSLPIYWGYYLLNPFNLIYAIIFYLCYVLALAGLNFVIIMIYD